MIRINGTELNQWDTGRGVVVTGIEAEHVHLANQGDSKAVIIGLVDNDDAPIPNFLLQTGKPLCVYAVKDGVTLESKMFSVKKRPRPENYVYEDDQRNYIYELITDANNAIESARNAADGANQAAKEAEDAAKEAEAAAEELAPLIVATKDWSYSASYNAADIWNAVAAGRDVILAISGYGRPKDCSAPILSATKEQAIFAIIEAGSLILFIIDTDGAIIRRGYPLSLYAILDDTKTDSSATWSSAKILAIIAQGGTGDIDMGDDRAVKCGRVSAPELHVTDSIAEGFYVTSELVGGNYGKPVAVLNGTNGDEAVVLRHIAPGTEALDAVNKAQLDAVEATANSKAKIDNTAVGADAWSSQNTVDKLCPKVSESSPCVQMQPVGSSKVKVSVKKDSEYSHIKLYCTGKNLYPQDSSAFTANFYVNRESGDLTATDSSIASAFFPVSHLVGKTLAIAGAYVGGSKPGWMFYDSNKKWMGTQFGGNTATAVVPAGAAYFRFTIRKSNITVFDKETNKNVLDYSLIQLEIGNSVTEAEAYDEITFDPAVGDIELDRVFLDGVNTFYAYAGSMEEQTDGSITFVPTKAVDVHVEGYNHPAYEIEKQRQEIEQLKGIVLSLGASMTV